MKTDLKSAFRVLPGQVSEFWLVIMKAEHPASGKVYYFIDKSMPFGASISCSNFQHFSNALKHLVERLKGIERTVTNYLDDFFVPAFPQENLYGVNSGILGHL